MRTRYSGIKRKLWVVLPMRGIAQGKSRLADVLDRTERARLNRKLLERTLAIIACWQGCLSRCIVISGCAQTLRIADGAGARTLIEPRPRRGLNYAVGYAAAQAVRQGGRGVVVLPSDLPLLSVTALDALIEQAALESAGVIAPNATRTGTNALLLKRRGRFDFSYGPESHARHIEAARLRGWALAVCMHPQLALDIDLPPDLIAWRNKTKTLR